MTALESSAPARRREPDRTQDERLFECPSPHDIEDYTNTDPWRLMRIMGEFVQGFEELADITRGVAMFGSARLDPDNPWYQLAVETAKQFGQANWIVLTGAGPGIMEACNKGAREASTLSVGLNIELEALTLIQTGKIKNLPVVLMGRDYWDDIMKWLRDTLVKHGMLDGDALSIVHVTDDPSDAVRHVRESGPLV